MRSFILKATLAATLASIPLSVSYAASSATGHSASSAGSHAASTAGGHSAGTSARAELGAAERAGREKGKLQNGEADRPPYMTDPMTSQPSYQTFGLANPPTYRGDRLATIEQELGRARHQANIDRRRGELTPREARFVRREDAAVRSEAVGIARQNGGQIPAASYAMLQDRVSDLNRTIYSYETGAKRG